MSPLEEGTHEDQAKDSNTEGPSDLQHSAAEVANYFIEKSRNGDREPMELGNGATVHYQNILAGDRNQGMLVFLPSGERIFINAHDPENSSQLLLPPEKGSPDGAQFTVATVDNNLLMEKVGRFLDLMKAEIVRTNLETEDDTIDGNSVLESLNI